MITTPAFVVMPGKPSGGRGKRESYTSSVMRVPDPIKHQVLKLIEEFHQHRPHKPVTGTDLPFQIPMALVVKMLRAAYPVGVADYNHNHSGSQRFFIGGRFYHLFFMN